MRLSPLAALAAAVLVSACSDASPVATRSADDNLYDLSKVTITRGNGAVPAHPAGSVKADGQDPSFICNPDYDTCPQPLPRATYDYGSYTETGYSGSDKLVHLVAWSDQYAHIDWMDLTAHFKSVGGQGSLGCSATPGQFEQETVSGFGSWFVDHWTIYSERWAQYPSSATFVWEVAGDHTFYAEADWGVTRYSDVGTFYSSARVCY